MFRVKKCPKNLDISDPFGMVNVESLFVCKRRKGRPPDSHGSSRRTKTEPGGEGGGIFVCSDHLEHRRRTVSSILVLCRSTQMFNTVECTACRDHLVITFLNSIAPLIEICFFLHRRCSCSHNSLLDLKGYPVHSTPTFWSTAHLSLPKAFLPSLTIYIGIHAAV